jgi:hypothetical protein
MAVLAVWVAVMASGVVPAGAETLYSFNFWYSDGSNDAYQGSFYAPDGWLQVGSTISNQPAPMGGAALGGSYYIYALQSGYDASMDAQEYITGYYDYDTGYKMSSIIATSTGQTGLTSSYIQVNDRRYSAESGYAYDPSVPSSDAYFGSPDVCYSFNTSTNSANFLASYNSVSGYYWKPPSDYPTSGAEVAAATLAAAADNSSNSTYYANMITTDWQTLWPNNTKDSPTSYVSFIGTLCTDMGWVSGSGTPRSSVGPGLLTYIQGQGYSTATYDYHNLTSGSRSDIWSAFKSAVHDEPIIVQLASTSFGTGYHYGNVLGYWNDGHVVVDWDKGTSFTLDGASYSYPNVKLNFYQTTTGSSEKTAELVYYWLFYDTVQH